MSQDDLPAILGGKPIRPEGPPPWPVADAKIEEALQKSIRDNTWGLYNGPHTARLDETLREKFQVPSVLLLASGTLAVEVALRAAQIGPGDEVILAAYEYEPNFLCVHAVGATPVLVDVHSHNAALDETKFAEAISPRTKAVIVSHLHGAIVRTEHIRNRSIIVIEDRAQCPGMLPASTCDMAVLSFGGSKPLSAGRGGALLFNDNALYSKAKSILKRGVQQWGVLAELQAVVLVPQLLDLEERALQRYRSVEELRRKLVEIPGLTIFDNLESEKSSRPDYYKLGFFFTPEAFGLTRELFVQSLRAEGIAFSPGFRALHSGRSPKRFRAPSPLIHAEMASECVVTLHHPVLLAGQSELEQVALAVLKTYRNSKRIAEADLASKPPLRFED